MDERRNVDLYTDGACLGNPGPGGYGAVLLYKDLRKELSGGYRKTTNNRMELLGVIVGLAALKEPCKVTIYSDSQYVVKGMLLGWVRKWKQQGWKRGKDAVPNPDLWERLLAACDQHDVTWQWVRGHNGNVENERADRLSVAAANQPDLPPDPHYEARR